jgi:hypothetical protein
MDMATSIRSSIHNIPYVVKKSTKDYLLKHSWSSSTHDEIVVARHVKAVIDWILNAQSACGCGGGIPAYYTLRGGFSNPYPETSGYIITSLLAGYNHFHDESYKSAAVDIADWLTSRQLDSGAMRCNIEHPRSMLDKNRSGIDVSKIFLFDCGAILEGLTNMWKQIPEDRFRLSSIRLADYMISNQEDNGLWEKDLYFPYFGTHQTRTMWALINAGRTFNKSEYIDSALRCLNKLKLNVKPNAYIANCHFVQEENEDFGLTHPIAYAIEGFFEAGIMLGLREFSEIAINVGYELQRMAENRQQMFFSHYNSHWEPVSSYQCVTGNIQIAMMWLKIAKYTGDDALISTAIKFLNFIRNCMIDTETEIAGVRGAIQGSFPIYGRYCPYAFPNWGAKFFIDASLLELEAMRNKKVGD